MKSFLACVFLLALIGGGLCARQRRQAPEAAAGGAEAGGPPAGVPTVAEVDGLQLAISALEAKPEPDVVKIEKLKAIQAFLNSEKAKAPAAAAPPAPAAQA